MLLVLPEHDRLARRHVRQDLAEQVDLGPRLLAHLDVELLDVAVRVAEQEVRDVLRDGLAGQGGLLTLGDTALVESVQQRGDRLRAAQERLLEPLLHLHPLGDAHQGLNCLTRGLDLVGRSEEEERGLLLVGARLLHAAVVGSVRLVDLVHLRCLRPEQERHRVRRDHNLDLRDVGRLLTVRERHVLQVPVLLGGAAAAATTLATLVALASATVAAATAEVVVVVVVLAAALALALATALALALAEARLHTADAGAERVLSRESFILHRAQRVTPVLRRKHVSFGHRLRCGGETLIPMKYRYCS
eukprot:Rhum_TRINITY_DN14670_c6_g2::Rhum_TRINITY_DN14670_c6_g2_i1::g.108328::m.108328